MCRAAQTRRISAVIAQKQAELGFATAASPVTLRNSIVSHPQRGSPANMLSPAKARSAVHSDPQGTRVDMWHVLGSFVVTRHWPDRALPSVSCNIRLY